MDKKSLPVIFGLVAFLLIWQMVILPMFPEHMMEEPIPHRSSANVIQPAPVSGNLSAAPTPQLIPEQPPLAEVTTPVEKPDVDLSPATVEKSEPKTALPEVFTTIETDIFQARFSSKGGVLTHLVIKDIHPTIDSKEGMTLLKTPSLVRSATRGDMIPTESQGENGPTLTYTSDTERVIYRFTEGSHFFSVEHASLKSPQALQLNLPVIEKDPSANNSQFTQGNDGAICSIKGRSEGDNSTAKTLGELQELGSTGLVLETKSSELQYAGFRNKYFGVFLEPGKNNPNQHNVQFVSQGESAQMILYSSQAESSSYELYAGPLTRDLLYRVDSERYGALFDYTGLNVVIHFLLWLLDFYNSFPAINMGVAILMLTLTVKVVLFPMNLKAQSSMFMMSKIGPQIKELQEKYKNDRQQLGVKQMELFRENGVNPLAGCLPMLIQMPVFISLFSTIGEGFPLRHAPFIGWIQDLSAPDAFMTMSFHIPFLGNADGMTTNLNLLVLLYVITMLIQQSMMPKSTDPQQQQMQKTMKFVMIGFAFILYNYSSGLMLYFVGSNTLGMMESWYIRNKVLPAIEAKKKAKA